MSSAGPTGGATASPPATSTIPTAGPGPLATPNLTIGNTVTTLPGAPPPTVAVAGYVDGVGTAARFSTPTGVALDARGDVYVADTADDCIRKIR